MESHDADLSITAIGEISALTLNHFFAQRAMRAFGDHFNEALRHTDVTASQFCMLALLHQREPLVFGDMAAELAMDRSNLSSNLAPLFRRRLVSIIAHDVDRRKRQLVLTTEGREVIASSIVPWSQAYRNMSAFVRQIDLDSMRDLFFAIRKRDQASNVPHGRKAPDSGKTRLF
ncbi:DNA-binding MarR family transcriptional regulator [Paraburkholderia sp. RAU6.4a]|uniref:MarR family winged helix-turn-helix transcriptional regulator n=1 Tax=Paraburkholderia sp. RAU6.4a TaxID=2991067 RepID=UPI003D1DA942